MAKTTPRKTKAKLSDFKPQRENINKGKPHALTALDSSIRRNGYGAPMVAAADGELFVGSKRLERSADIFGLDVKPIVVESDGTRPVVHVRTDIKTADDPRAQEMGYEDNVIAVMDWNPDGELLAQLAKENEIVAALAKQENESLKALREHQKGEATDAEPKPDEAEALLKKWKVKSGQSFSVGRHKVYCDDSDNIKAEADMVVTDPPYDLAIRQVVSIVERFASRAVLLVAGKQAFELLKDCPEWEYRLDFIWHHRRPRWICANHMPVFHHNNILVICKPKTKTGFSAPAKESSTVIETEVEYENSAMTHSKSAELFEKMMNGFAFKNVVDPFLGTGATLIACENTGRTCVGIEQEPSTLAVALERFKDCGLTPQRV